MATKGIDCEFSRDICNGVNPHDCKSDLMSVRRFPALEPRPSGCGDTRGFKTRPGRGKHLFGGALAFALLALCLTSAKADERTIRDQIGNALLPQNRSKFVDLFEKKLLMGESAKFMRDQVIFATEAKGNERPKLAKMIFDKYIKVGANREININNPTREAIAKGLDKANPSLFADAYNQILSLAAANIENNKSQKKVWEEWVKSNLK